MHKLARKTLISLSSSARRTFMGKESTHFLEKMSGKIPDVPYESDIVVIGGGLVGMMCAYCIKQLHPVAYGVAVIEKDTSLKDSATSVFYEGLSQQYDREDYLNMAKYSAQFLRSVGELLAIPDLHTPDISFSPQGCLMLAEDETSANNLQKAAMLQSSMGVDVEVMNTEELGGLYPWINPSTITLASLGYSCEGCYDVGLLIGALKGKAASLGVRFINGEVVGFGKEKQRVYSKFTQSVQNRFTMKEVMVKVTSTQQTHPLKFSRCLIAAGSSSGKVAELAGIGVDETTYTPLPIRPRLKHVYLLECLDGPGLDMPMLRHKDIFIRRHNQLGHYICTALHPLDDSNGDSMTYFEQHVHPSLTNLIPVFKSIKLLQHWHGHTDHNDFDGGLLVGNHPYYLNLFMAVGGPSLELAPAVGRTIMEMMLKDRVELIDPSNMTFDRVIYDEKNLATP